MLLRLLPVAVLASAVALAQPALRAWAEPAEHVVQPGENLWGIAADYGISLADLIAVNHLANPDLIHPGQVLLLPGAAAAEPQPGVPAESAAEAVGAEPERRARTSTRGGGRPAEVNVHIVQPGDTLGRIAQGYGLSVADLLAVNDLPNPDVLAVGQEIVLPGGAAAEAAPAVASAPRYPTVGGRYPIGTTLTGKVTMYCLRGVMRYGEYVHEGAAAADPSVFPAGTILEVAGLGRYVIKDTLAYDLGEVRVDIWQPSCAVALAWGLRYRDLTVVGP